MAGGLRREGCAERVATRGLCREGCDERVVAGLSTTLVTVLHAPQYVFQVALSCKERSTQRFSPGNVSWLHRSLSRSSSSLPFSPLLHAMSTFLPVMRKLRGLLSGKF